MAPDHGVGFDDGEHLFASRLETESGGPERTIERR